MKKHNIKDSPFYNQIEDRRRLNYGELLLTKEWFNKRLKIIERDKECCALCGAEETVNLGREYIWYGEFHHCVGIDQDGKKSLVIYLK